MAEYKPGKYRLEDLIEVVVFYSNHDVAWFSVGSNSNVVREHWSSFSNRKPEYLGPAVIGADDEQTGLSAACKINSILADQAGELLRERDEYRRKWCEAVEEVRRLQREVDTRWKEIFYWKNVFSEKKKENERLKRGNWTAEELASLGKVVSGCDAWVSFLSDKSVKYSVDADGVEWYRFDSVTVAVRDGKEASCRLFQGTWVPMSGDQIGFGGKTREKQEAWCRKQLVPVDEWRPATVEDVTRKPECRVRRSDRGEWIPKRLIAHETASTSGPWVTVSEIGCVGAWPICEVRK